LDSFYVLVILSNYVGFRFFPLGIWWFWAIFSKRILCRIDLPFFFWSSNKYSLRKKLKCWYDNKKDDLIHLFPNIFYFTPPKLVKDYKSKTLYNWLINLHFL
jgi:hypothetical protein